MSSSQLTLHLASEEQKLLACIHCGLCLEACPTYTVTGDENDGPRGRLYLMRAVGEGRLPSDSQAFERHIDRCLGCRACEQVCPAGVEYGELLEASRGEIFASGARRGLRYGLLRLVLKHIWLHPRRLKFAFAATRLLRDSGLAQLSLKSGLAKLISSRFEFSLALLQSSSGKRFKMATADKDGKPGSVPPKHDASQKQAMLFQGCVGSGLFARINTATARVLNANHYNVRIPDRQVCCGALHAHAGDLEGARALARKNIAAFSNDGDDGDTPVITNAGGCGAMLVSYRHLLADDMALAEEADRFSKRVRDVSQQLNADGKKMAGSGAASSQAITYDASCHLLYGQQVGEAPLEMLGAVSDLNFTKLEGSERCCGGAGIYNLLEPDLSGSVLAEKIANVRATGARILATGNAGCQMQIGAGALLAGIDLVTCHPIELLDEAYARAGLYDSTRC